MERVAIADADPTDFGDDAERRGLSESLGATRVAVNHYRIPPGEGFPGGLHAHADQEEVFVVLSGEATFEWLDADRDDARELTVGEGQVVRFPAGEYQSGRNEGETALVALALGAPRDGEDVRVPIACPACDHEELRPEWSDDGDGTDGGAVLVCPDCGAENVPEGCPECGREMRAALGEDAETVAVCLDCGTDVPTPFRE